MLFTNRDGEFTVTTYDPGGGLSTAQLEVHAPDGTLIATISAPLAEDFHWTSSGYAALLKIDGVGGESRLRRWARDGTVLETRPVRALAAASDAHGGTVVVELPAQDAGAAGSPVPALRWIAASGEVTRTALLDGTAALAPGTDVVSANVAALGATDHVLVILNRFAPAGGTPRPFARWFGSADPITAWFDASAALLSIHPLVLADGRLALNGSYGPSRGWSVFPDGAARVDPAPTWLQGSALYYRSIVVIRGSRGYAMFGWPTPNSLPPPYAGVQVLTADGAQCGRLPVADNRGIVGVDGTVFQPNTAPAGGTCELSWWSGLLR